jgi:hypothetical protein
MLWVDRQPLSSYCCWCIRDYELSFLVAAYAGYVPSCAEYEHLIRYKKSFKPLLHFVYSLSYIETSWTNTPITSSSSSVELWGMSPLWRKCGIKETRQYDDKEACEGWSTILIGGLFPAMHDGWHQIHRTQRAGQCCCGQAWWCCCPSVLIVSGRELSNPSNPKRRAL